MATRRRVAAAALAVLLLSASPAAADSLRLATVTEDGVTGVRVVYVGDERRNVVGISLARNEDIAVGAPEPGKVVGFFVSGAASPGQGCEPHPRYRVQHGAAAVRDTGWHAAARATG